MKSVDMLVNMGPEDAARLSDIMHSFECIKPATSCIMCPYQNSCAFIDILYHELRALAVEVVTKAR